MHLLMLWGILHTPAKQKRKETGHFSWVKMFPRPMTVYRLQSHVTVGWASHAYTPQISGKGAALLLIDASDRQ